MTNRPAEATGNATGTTSPRRSRTRHALDTVRGAVPGVVGRYRRNWLTVAGLALLTAAAWSLDLAAGLAAAGVSCLLLGYLTGRERTTG